ncbi:Gfo/Idh/MocA family oxidoreductase [Candidatus Pelagibacter ubique]|nr:Gfo/Idh/MocA family oxidoreductase [Candidatus Pelagibacter ubique]
MNKNIAVVGCGHWGKNLVRNFYELGVLASICDPNIDIAEQFSKQYSVQNHSFSEIINDPNIKGVVLAVPAKHHAAMAIDAMKQGKHVFVEKPLAMNEAEATLMIETAKENKVQLMVGHLLQYHPVFQKVKEMVISGVIGEITYIYSNRLSFGKVRTEEDVIWSFAPHDISMILSLANQEPEFVSAHSTAILQENIADSAIIHITFKSGLKSHISVSWLHPYKEQKLVVTGKKAMLVFDDTKPWNEKLSIQRYQAEINQGSPSLKKEDLEFIKVIEDEPLKNECQHFIDVVKNKSKPLTNEYEGLNVLKVLTAATKSQKENKIIKI